MSDHELLPQSLTVQGSTQSIVVETQAQISTRQNQAIPYLLGAARYSRLVGRIETANAGHDLGAFWDELQDHAISCVLFLDAAIESYSNELFADAAQVFPVAFIPGLQVLWSELEKQKSSLDKLDLALSLRGKSKLNRKLPLLKAVHALGSLRNEMTHFKPEWFDRQDKHLKVSSKLAGFFTPSPWFPNESLFPRAWMSHSCTKWAVATAVDFLQHFEQCADLTNRTNWASWQSRQTA